jgi:hypothetical protein
MSVGWLIFLNIASIPFLAQAEAEGLARGRFPSLFPILSLAHVRRQRWFLGYLVLAFLFFLLAIVPSSSGRVYSASIAMIGAVLVAQVFLWAFVVVKVSKFSKGVNDGDES